MLIGAGGGGSISHYTWVYDYMSIIICFTSVSDNVISESFNSVRSLPSNATGNHISIYEMSTDESWVDHYHKW